MTKLFLFFSVAGLLLYGPNHNKIFINDVSQVDQKYSHKTVHEEYSYAFDLFNNDSLVKCMRKSLSLSQRLEREKNHRDFLYRTYFIIGNIFRINKDHKKAIQYYRLSLKTLQSLSDLTIDKWGNESQKNEYNLAIANNYLKLGNQYLRSRVMDSAKYYLNLTLELDPIHPESRVYQASAAGNLSGIYSRESKLDLAQNFAKKAIESHRMTGNKISESAAVGNLASAYLIDGKYEQAKDAYLEGIELLKGEMSDRALKVKERLYFNLAYNLYLMKDHRAYHYQELSHLLIDSITKEESRKTIEEIHSKYNFEKGREIGIQRELLAKQKAQRNTWVIGVGLTLIIVILGFVLNQYKLKQKNLQLALSKKETESQMEVLNANLKGQEEERKRISQELHDGVLSRLFGSRMGLGYLELDGDKETQEQYEKFLDELQNIEKEIRGVSHQLSSDITISETSFINAVNQLLKEKSKLGDFDFQLKMDDGFSWKELDGILEMNLFRILQESLQNILKHAQAQKVFVSFKVEKQQIVLEITDDGVGFDTSTKGKGIGLKNIDARVHKLKGNFDLQTKKGQGTALTISLPIT